MFVVSIIIPCYNQGKYLDETLSSVFFQTYKTWECIIVNDGSVDNTEKIALDWCKKDNRFNYINKDNKGLSSARNTGLEIAKGDYILFLDADDALDSKKTEKSLSFLKKKYGQKKNIVISNFRMFSYNIHSSTEPYCILDERVFTLDMILYKWEKVFTIPIHCALFERELFKNFKFPEELQAKEDWIMWLTIIQDDIHIHFIDEPLALYRTHTESMTNDNVLMRSNMVKAINLLPEILSSKKCLEFYLFLLHQKQTEINGLRHTIKNYQKSSTYKISKKLGKFYMIRSIFKLLSKYL